MLSLTEAESQAAASVTDAILGDFAKKGGYEHVPVVAEAEVAPPPAAAAPPVPSTPAPAAAAAEPATPATPEAPAAAEIPSFEPELTDDLRALLDEPDFDAEADAEINAELEANPDDTIDVDQAKSDRSKDKRIAFLEAQLVAKSRNNWVAENLRAYPLLREYAKDEVNAFKATSRRAFAREAAALNTRLETIAKPMLTDIAALKASLKGEAYVEGKAEAKAAFGAPAGDVAGTGVSAQNAADLAAAEKTGSLKNIFKAMLKDNPLV